MACKSEILFSSKMQQKTCKSEILAPKCSKWQGTLPHTEKQKTIKTKTRQNPKTNHRSSSSNFVPLLLQHTFKASDLVPDIFQSNTASRYVFILPTWPFSLQKITFSQLPNSEVSLVYPSHFHIDSFRSLPFGLKSSATPTIKDTQRYRNHQESNLMCWYLLDDARAVYVLYVVSLGLASTKQNSSSMVACAHKTGQTYKIPMSLEPFGMM